MSDIARVIDVLIPVYNASRTISSALDSIQTQTIPDIRIIVVDDGSTDGTAAIVADMATMDPRVELHRKENGGIVDALNFGLQQCRAEFVARFDGDDLSHPERFARQLGFLRANPDYVAVGGRVRHIDEDGQPTGSVVDVGPPELADLNWVPSLEPYIIHPFLMARRAGMDAVGGYRHVLHAEDTDLFWRLQERGKLHNLEDTLGDYRMHANSVSSASVHNARVSAAHSQLAGISALRRRGGEADLVFEQQSLAEFDGAASIQAVFALACRGLSPAERDRLELSLAAKMLELASYRPFELENTDCRFIRSAVRRHGGLLSPANRNVLDKQLCGSAARMAAEGAVSNALDLLRPRLYPGFLGRLAARKLMLRKAFRRVRSLTGRATFHK
jgi:glycosyltransferase involved in cell wall biosynthesis